MRFQGKYLIAIDATGITPYQKKHCDDCLYTESKNGVKTYYHKVLEARIVTANGFSISICTVWVHNKDINDGNTTNKAVRQKYSIFYNLQKQQLGLYCNIERMKFKGILGKDTLAYQRVSSI